MDILNYFSKLFHHQGAAIKVMQEESRRTDEISKKGFDSLLAVLNDQINMLEIIKNTWEPHICWNFPTTHPYHDTWD